MRSSGAVTRRNVSKGLAWSLPVVALAAPAPAFAASGPCPAGSCVTPIVGAAPATTGVFSGNTGTVSVVPAAAPAGFGLIIGCSGFISGGIVTVTAARLTMSDGATYNANSLALGVAAGALGATAVVFSGAFIFPGVHFPNGTYVSALGVDSSPVRPTGLCVDFTLPISIGVGLPTQDCPSDDLLQADLPGRDRRHGRHLPLPEQCQLRHHLGRRLNPAHLVRHGRASFSCRRSSSVAE